MPTCDVSVGNVRTDEAGASGNDNAQTALLSKTASGRRGSPMPPYALLLCAAAAVLGTLAANAQSLPLDARAAVAAGSIALCAFALSGSCKSPQLRVLTLTALAAAFANASWHANMQMPVSAARTATYAAAVLERSPGSFVAMLGGGARVLAYSSGPIPAPGTRIAVRGRLEPFDDARNPGEPSERAIQHERGLDARLAAATVLSTNAAGSASPRAWLARAHEWAHAQLALRLGEPGASVVAGELWGERSSLPPDLREEFQETGTVHILVTAGLHVGVVAALCVGLFSLLTLPRAVTCTIVAIIVWIF
ncbi:MAG: ComEC family DNA internalization-related competence protein, partial [Candidatus Eremiobacteraeota bacterium]|nr:ComEC family DNA internalization-related competence protein [Candidatus Eremiobacteraeota bacterium]